MASLEKSIRLLEENIVFTALGLMVFLRTQKTLNVKVNKLSFIKSIVIFINDIINEVKRQEAYWEKIFAYTQQKTHIDNIKP